MDGDRAQLSLFDEPDAVEPDQDDGSWEAWWATLPKTPLDSDELEDAA